MEFPPQKFREIVFQLLFSFDATGEAEAQLVPFLMGELAVSKKHIAAAYHRASAIWKETPQLDSRLAQEAKAYSLERIKAVEKNVLRVALYELLIEKQLSKKIIISEACRLTRKFGTPEGAAFVNAVLDTLTESTENGSSFSPSENYSSQ